MCGDPPMIFVYRFKSFHFFASLYLRFLFMEAEPPQGVRFLYHMTMIWIYGSLLLKLCPYLGQCMSLTLPYYVPNTPYGFIKICHINVLDFALLLIIQAPHLS